MRKTSPKWAGLGRSWTAGAGCGEIRGKERIVMLEVKLHRKPVRDCPQQDAVLKSFVIRLINPL